MRLTELILAFLSLPEKKIVNLLLALSRMQLSLSWEETRNAAGLSDKANRKKAAIGQPSIIETAFLHIPTLWCEKEKFFTGINMVG